MNHVMCEDRPIYMYDQRCKVDALTSYAESPDLSFSSSTVDWGQCHILAPTPPSVHSSHRIEVHDWWMAHSGSRGMVGCQPWKARMRSSLAERVNRSAIVSTRQQRSTKRAIEWLKGSEERTDKTSKGLSERGSEGGSSIARRRLAPQIAIWSYPHRCIVGHSQLA